MKKTSVGIVLWMSTCSAFAAENPLTPLWNQIDRNTEWVLEKEQKLHFKTYHTQGMTKAGGRFFLSSVEILKKTKRYDHPLDGYDRTPGSGIGHLFVFDPATGQLLNTITLGESDIYHPGGIDYDGRFVWVPVAQYRPDSLSVIYRIDPETLEVHEVLRTRDHIGGVVFDPTTSLLHGVSWGSRRFYTWKLNENLTGIMADPTMQNNPQHFIDYQDCQLSGAHQMLCSGLAKYEVPEAGTISFGGLDLVNLESGLPVHQIPVQPWIRPNHVMSNNPFYAEAMPDRKIRIYFVPEDDQSTLYVYSLKLESLL